MDSSNPVRKVFIFEPGGGSRRKGRPRRAKQVTENVTTLRIRNWQYIQKVLIGCVGYLTYLVN